MRNIRYETSATIGYFTFTKTPLKARNINGEQYK